MLERNFTLKIGGQSVGRVVNVSVHWPWHKAEFISTPAFEPYSALFAECLAEKESDKRERLMADIFGQGLELVAEEAGTVFKSTPWAFKRGEIVRFFVEGGGARFRFG